MASHDLRIKILGILDKTNTQKSINEQLREIEKSVGKIDVGIGKIDTKEIDKLGKTVRELQGIMESIGKNAKPLKIFNNDDIVKENRKVLDSVEQVKKELSSIGTVSITNKALDPLTKDVLSFTANVTKANGEVEKLKMSLVNVANGRDSTLTQKFIVDKITVNDNTSKIRENVLQEELSTRNKISQVEAKAQADRERALQEEQKIRNKIANDAIRSEEQLASFKQNASFKATNLNNKFGTNVDSKGINDYLNSVNRLTTSTPHLNLEMQKLNEQFKLIHSNAQQASKAQTGFLGSLKNGMAFLAGGSLFYGLINGAQEYVKTLSEVEFGMAGVAQTVPMLHGNQSLLNETTKDFISIAEKYGESMHDLTEAGKDWSRVYKDIPTILEMVTSASLLATVDNMRLIDANKNLEGALSQFGMIAKDSGEAFEFSRKVIDAWSTVAHNSFINAKDLSDGIVRFGSVAKQAGIDFDTANALMATASRNTALHGADLGNMFKSVIGSIHSKKAIQELESFGVAVMEVKNGVESYRPLKSVFEDMMIATAGSERSVEDLNKAVSGGKFQWAKLSSTIADYVSYVKGLEQSINSVGKTSEYSGIIMDTLAKKYERLKQHIVGLVVETGEGGLTTTLKSLTDMAINLVSGFENMDGTVLKAGLAFITIATVAPRVIGAIEGITVALRGLAVGEAVVAALSGNIGFLLAGLAAGGLTAYAFASGSATEETNKLKQAQDELVKSAPQFADMYLRQSDAIVDFGNNIKKINEELAKPSTQGNAERIRQLNEMKKAAQDALLTMVDSETGGKISASGFSIAEIKKASEALKEKSQMSEMMIAAGKGEEVVLNDLTEKYVTLKKEIMSNNFSGEELIKKKLELHAVTEKLSTLIPSIITGFDNEGNAVTALDGNLKDNSKTMQDYIKVVKELQNIELTKKIEDQSSAVKDAEAKMQKAKDYYALLVKINESGGDGTGMFPSSPKDMEKARQEMEKATAEHTKQATVLQALTLQQKAYEESVKESAKAEKESYNGAGYAGKIIQEKKNILKDTTDATFAYNKAEVELYKTGRISEATTKKLIKINGDFINIKNKSKEEIKSWLEQQKKANVESIQSEIESTKNTIEQVKQRVTARVQEILAIRNISMEGAKKNAQEIIDMIELKEMNYNNDTTGKLPAVTDAEWARYKKASETLAELHKGNTEIQSLQGIIDGLEAQAKSITKNADLESAMAKDKEKKEKKAKDLAEEAARAEKEREDQIRKVYEEKIKLADLELAYQDRLQKSYEKGSQKWLQAQEEKIKLKKQELALMDTEAKRLDKVDAQQSAKAKTSTTTVQTTKTTGGNGVNKDVANYYLSSKFRLSTPFAVKDKLHPSGHMGIDLASPAGTLIKSVTDGVVTQVFKNNKTAGNAVIIKGNNGYTYQYNHMLKTPSVKIGQPVSAGTELGKVGSTGRSTGNHLDLKVKDSKGNYVDPLKHLKGATGTSTKGTETITITTGKNIDDAKTRAIDIRQNMEKLKEEISQLSFEKIDGQIYNFDKSIENSNKNIEILGKSSKNLVPTSQEYINNLKQQQKENENIAEQQHQKADFLRNQIKNNKDLTDEQKKQLEIQIKQAQSNWWDAHNSAYDLMIEQMDRVIERQEKINDQIDKDIQLSETRMRGYEKGTVEYNQEQAKIMKGYDARIKAEQKYQKELEATIQSKKLAGVALDNYNKKLKESIAKEQEFIATRRQESLQMAQDMIDLMVDGYEKQKQAALDTLDEKEKAEEKAHQDTMDRLDEQSSKYDEILKKMTDEIDKQKANQDYEKRLAQLQKDRQKLFNQLAELSLDNSWEAQARKKDLAQQLADKEVEISELTEDRQRELRKESLNDQAEIYRKDIEAKKKAEQKKYDAEKERLDKVRKETERSWDNIINDEKWKTQIREDMLNGHYDNIIKGLQDMASKFPDITKSIGESITENITNKFKQAIDQLEKLKSTPEPDQGTGGGSTGSGTGSSGGDLNSSAQSILSKMKENSIAWANASSKEERDRLEAFNESLANAYNTKYSDNQIYKKSDGAWYYKKDNKRVYHDGGTVGGNPTKVDALLHRIANEGRNEVTSLLEVGENVVTEKGTKNVTNYISNLENALLKPNFMPSFSAPNIPDIKNVNNNQPVNIHNEYKISVENMNGTQQDIDKAMKEVVRKMEEVTYKAHLRTGRGGGRG